MDYGAPVVAFGLVAYLLAIAIVTVLAYLVIRFGVRDGLRAHALWLERRRSPQ